MKKLTIAGCRRAFPILREKVYGKPLTYLDNAATTQRPTAVIDAMVEYYTKYNSNVHRGVYSLSQRASDAFEGVRTTVQAFIHAKRVEEIILTKGTTEGINLLASTIGVQRVHAGDTVVVSVMEHHANLVPWQQLCDRVGASLKVIPIDRTGQLQMNALDTVITAKTKIVAVTHVSNSLGVVNPIADIIKKAHAVGAIAVIDGAQAIAHVPVDVQQLDADFYVFSGHKMYGPTGVGVLYGKYALLESMPPYQFGGDMIHTVSFTGTTFNLPPSKFEAGTPPIAEVIGLGAAIQFIQSLGMAAIKKQEQKLYAYATKALSVVPGVTIYAQNPSNAPVISFTVEGIHPHDLGTVLDQEGVCIRTGHHCTQPLMTVLGVPATARISMAVYNTTMEIDRCVRAIKQAKKLLLTTS